MWTHRWPVAETSERAAYFAGSKTPRLHVEMGNYWVMRSRTFMPGDARQNAAWTNACRHFQKSLTLGDGKKANETLRDEIRRTVMDAYGDKKRSGRLWAEAGFHSFPLSSESSRAGALDIAFQLAELYAHLLLLSGYPRHKWRWTYPSSWMVLKKVAGSMIGIPS